MVNLIKAKQAFATYVKQYDIKDEQVHLKVIHTYKVMEACERIVTEQALDQTNQDIAMLIALLHDIGRFEQIRRFHTFIDSQSVNHALLGIEVLKENNFIRCFIEDDQYDALIYAAIRNHNRFMIEPGLTPLEQLHAKLIRDSDKIDIFRVNLEESKEILYLCDDQTLRNDVISDEVFEDFKQGITILSAKRKTHIDYLVSHIALLFDLNFPTSFRLIEERDIINKIIDRTNYEHPITKQRMQVIAQYADVYIKRALMEANR